MVAPETEETVVNVDGTRLRVLSKQLASGQRTAEFTIEGMIPPISELTAEDVAEFMEKHDMILRALDERGYTVQNGNGKS